MSIDDIQASFVDVLENSAIDVAALITDNPNMSVEDVVAMAQSLHARAMQQLKVVKANQPAQLEPFDTPYNGWNEGIPYCVNDPAPFLEVV